MSEKKHHGGPAPVPPGNQPRLGTSGEELEAGRHGEAETNGTEEQDGKRRLGGFDGAGEHSRVQPSPLNDGAHGGHGGRSKQ